MDRAAGLPGDSARDSRSSRVVGWALCRVGRGRSPRSPSRRMLCVMHWVMVSGRRVAVERLSLVYGGGDLIPQLRLGHVSLYLTK
jgi:hypothetical protein